MENNPLSLVVKEKTLGNLVTNAKDIQQFVIEKIKEYSVDNYPGDAKQAAKDKAELNAAAKTLNDRRIALEKEWLMPFQDFKQIIAETTDMIKTASGKLDAIVRQKEDEEKAAKREAVEAIWAKKNFNLVTLDRVFRARWLNKTVKLPCIEDEIDSIIMTVTNDLAALDAFGADTALLKDLYLSNLNLQQTLNRGAELRANRERLAALEAEKKAAAELAAEKEAAAIVTDQEVPEKTEDAEPAAQTAQTSEKEYLFNVYGASGEVESVKAVAEEMGLKVIPSVMLEATATQIAQFKALLADNGVGYDKVQVTNLAAKRN